MSKELKKISQQEFYFAVIVLLYSILLFLMLISMISIMIYFLNRYPLLISIGVLIISFYIFYKLKKLNKMIYKENPNQSKRR